MVDARLHACAYMDVAIVRAADMHVKWYPIFLEPPAAKLAVIS